MKSRFSENNDKENVASNSNPWDDLLHASRRDNWKAECIRSKQAEKLAHRVGGDLLETKEVTTEQLRERNVTGMGHCMGSIFVNSVGVSANRFRRMASAHADEEDKNYQRNVVELGGKFHDALIKQGAYCKNNRPSFWGSRGRPDLSECEAIDTIAKDIQTFTDRVKKITAK